VSTHLDELESRFNSIAKWQPKIEALIDFDDASARQRAAAARPGPLAGWPIAIKDIIDWAGTPTRCNAQFTSTRPVERNATIIDDLLAAGAFVMAKSITTTFAYLDPGPTRNPWNVAHTPGGSSSGSAAAVAAGMVRMALGSQTIASINRPASFCGVVGYKPTYGTLSTDGVFPFSPSVDTVGFFTANAADAQAAFFGLTSGEPKCVEAPLRIGVIDDMGCAPPDTNMAEAVRRAASRLTGAGHDAQTTELPDGAERAYEHHVQLVAAECAQSHRELFARHGRDYSPNLRELIRRGQAVTADTLCQIERHRGEIGKHLDALLDQFDLLISASAVGAAPKGLDSTGDPRMSLMWTYTGVPTLTLPVMLNTGGLPLGVQLIARKNHDAQLLAAGVEVEKVLGFDARL